MEGHTQSPQATTWWHEAGMASGQTPILRAWSVCVWLWLERLRTVHVCE